MIAEDEVDIDFLGGLDDSLTDMFRIESEYADSDCGWSIFDLQVFW